MTAKPKSLNELAKEVHKVAREHGWWDMPRNFPELLCLVHSEVSEALEEFHNGGEVHLIKFNTSNGTNNAIEPYGIPIEFADIFIRVLDICGAYDIDIDKAMQEKMKYNKIRTYRHGNKKA